jgi:hypothetical protein
LHVEAVAGDAGIGSATIISDATPFEEVAIIRFNAVEKFERRGDVGMIGGSGLSYFDVGSDGGRGGVTVTSRLGVTGTSEETDGCFYFLALGRQGMMFMQMVASRRAQNQ